MNKLINVLAALGLAMIGVLVALNWSILMTTTPIYLGVTQFQASVGVVVFGMAAALVAVFLLAYLRYQVSSLLETRALHKEILRLQEELRRLQGLADTADASRIDNLQHLVATEFRLLNERLSPVKAVASRLSLERTTNAI